MFNPRVLHVRGHDGELSDLFNVRDDSFIFKSPRLDSYLATFETRQINQ